MTKPVHRRALTLIHILGAMVCLAIVGTASAAGGSNCSQQYWLTCQMPCNRTQLRFNFACCNQFGNYCCQRECTVAICSGPPGSTCVKPETNEYFPGTMQQGKECINNYCQEP